MKYRKSIFIVTYSRTKQGIKYLVLKRKLHWKGWEFPKGGLEKSKDPLKNVKREVKEETGKLPFNIKNLHVSGKYKYKKELKDRKGVDGQTYSLYSAEIKSGLVKVDKKEHSNYKWLSFEKALKKQKLTAALKPRAHKVGCRGFCAKDVLVDVAINGRAETYQFVTPEKAKKIVESFLL